MKPIPERVEENKSPVESKALPHENVVIRCWKPDCRKVATCRDGSGWEWCDDHIDQEKTGSVLHTAQEYYDVDFYTERVRVCLTETDQQAREEEGKKAVLTFSQSLVNMIEAGGVEEVLNLLYKNAEALSNPPSQV